MSLASDLCVVLCACTICDINVPVPAGALVPCILHYQKPINKVRRVVYLGLLTLVWLKFSSTLAQTTQKKVVPASKMLYLNP